jgi:hypothetical protein
MAKLIAGHSSSGQNRLEIIMADLCESNMRAVEATAVGSGDEE